MTYVKKNQEEKKKQSDGQASKDHLKRRHIIDKNKWMIVKRKDTKKAYNKNA